MNIIPKAVALMEKQIAVIPMLVSLYANFYSEVVNNEISLAGITADDRVLNIGCGGIPFTSILIARQTGAKVWAVDRDSEAVNVARRCIEKTGLHRLIAVEHYNGVDPLPFDYSVAIVALQVEPKKEVLDNLMQNGIPGAKIIIRRPRPELSHQYDLLPLTPRPEALTAQKQVTFDSSVLYRVTDSPAEVSSCF